MRQEQSHKIDKSNVEDILALTPTQEGMLFHHVSSQDKGYYVQQLSVTIAGDLCSRTFQKAWDTVIHNNEMLRTVYRWVKLERPVQIVLKSHEIMVVEHDFSHCTPEESKKLAQAIKDKGRQLLPDLEREPFRITLCKLGSSTCDMILTWHHILFDGWSNGILLKEFLDAYRALASGNDPIVPEKSKFKQFIKWQSTQDKAPQELFWKEYLHGLEERTSLPESQENRNLSDPSAAGKFISVLTESETEDISRFVSRHELTLASLIYTTWGVLLSKYNQSDDVMFGTTVSGRVPHIQAIENMVGMFINTIPLRFQSEPDGRVQDVLRNVNGQLQKREEFENTPLQDIGSYSGLGNHEPLFNSIVVLENYPLDSSIQGDEALKLMHYQMHETTHYGLTLGVQTSGPLELDFSYDPALFSSCTVERMAGHFKRILKQMISQSDMRLRDIVVLTPEEQNQILTEFNSSPASAPSELMHRLFERQAELTPDQTAVTFNGASCTYREINERSNRLARYLRHQGVQPDQLVAIVMERSDAFIVAVLAVMKAGGAYVPIDHEYSQGRIEYILQDSQAEVLLIQAGLADAVSFEGRIILADSEEINTCNPANLENLNSPEHAAYIIYTSGSTGNPKGVVVEHRNLLAYVQAFQREFRLSSRDVFLQQASCSFDVFIEEVYPVLAAGGGIVIATRMDVMDIRRLNQLMQAHQVTMVSCSPLLLNELNKQPGMNSVHTYISGGDILKPEYTSELIKRAKIYNTYGPTEATVCATYYRCTSSLAKNIPIGRPIFNYQVYILDVNDNLLPIGIPGEICIGGNGVARGYLNQPDLTARKFAASPYLPGGRMYRTGDVGKWLPDGNIQFAGRNDEQIKIRGFRIEPGEVEHGLQTHAEIEEAVVLPVDDANGSKCLAAYMKTSRELAASEVRNYLSERLPHYMIPSLFYRIDAIPKTMNGKVDKKVLMQCNHPLDNGWEEESTANDTEDKIRSVWKDVLKVNNVGLHDNFFDIGGNSILLMQMHAKLEKEYSWGTQIVDLFSHTSIHKLAQWIDQKDRKLNESVFVQYQALPESYFERNMQASGAGVMRFHLPLAIREKLRLIARDNRVEEFDLLLAMMIYLLSELNGEKTAIVQCLQTNGEKVVPLQIDLAEMNNFEQLFTVVHKKRIHEIEQTYALKDTGMIHLSKEKHAILPFVSNNSDVSVDAAFLEIYDIALSFDEDPNEQPLAVTCKFNDKRIKKEAMNMFIKGYLDLIQQLTKSHVMS
ncbi:non-ribosomal peptide synthetase [Paenibacillus lutrae]|uniref:Amino acid adenylation domain-containing protein n=1 Tax=Paenibacillus lutrae TaxID=2078573 RepID=A0A7X3FK78_9BACL|nr:non-ribosomal peptide synthetase [Paenibacillus lutrae]MVP01211.1 amino acid adenylation domain-containing protein [Paenibacillus lutrae]